MSGGYTVAFYTLGVLATIGTILVGVVSVLDRRITQGFSHHRHKRGQCNEGMRGSE